MFSVECRCTTIWNYELRGNCFESQAEIFMEGGKRFSLVSFGRLMFFFFKKKNLLRQKMARSRPVLYKLFLFSTAD
jgi:hypothetical protein